MIRPGGLLLAVSALLYAACSDAPAPTGTAVRDVTVIDAVHGVRTHQVVVFDGDRIVQVADVGEATPAVASTIDGRGRYLIPGLWDMHVHLTYYDAFTPSMPDMFLYYGITSVRDTGGLLEKMRPVIAAMRAPDAVAPRVWFSGPLLDGSLVVYNGDSRAEIGVANPDAQTARATVATLVSAGVDFIKIYEMVEPPVFEALTSAAHEAGLPIAAHVPLSMTAGRAGPQVDSMEHLRNVELACAGNAWELHEERRARLANPEGLSGYDLRSSLHRLQRLPAIAAYDAGRCGEVLASLRNTIQVPTLRLNTMALAPPFARDDWADALALLPAGPRADWQQDAEDWHAAEEADDTTFAEWSLKLVGDMNGSGVPIGAGTDTPIGDAIPGYSLHNELQLLVRAGLTPIEALAAATVQPAVFFGLADQTGAIEAGMRADMLLLTANPVEDIANTRRIETVISKGRVWPRAALAERLQAVTKRQ